MQSEAFTENYWITQMSQSQYNPAIHHRRSIRLKGYDYAAGGLYFVTICAHRDAGAIFAPPAVKEMVAREWELAAAQGEEEEGGHKAPGSQEEGGHKAPGEEEEGGHKARPYVGAGLVPAPGSQEEGGHKARPYHDARPYVVMPDHFHSLLQLARGAKSLGDVIGAFKSRVVHEYIARVKAGEWPRFPGKIWHRNYYERIVWDAVAENNIARYIRMNPWRCVTDFGGGLRGMGNPALWNAEKLGVLCSRNAPKLAGIPPAAVYMSGFHSALEQEVFQRLLQQQRPIIWCPSWRLAGRLSPETLTALEGNRMLLLEMPAHGGNLASAEARNRFVLEHSDRLWLPHINSGGMLDRLVKELGSKGIAKTE